MCNRQNMTGGVVMHDCSVRGETIRNPDRCDVEKKNKWKQTHGFVFQDFSNSEHITINIETLTYPAHNELPVHSQR